MFRNNCESVHNKGRYYHWNSVDNPVSYIVFLYWELQCICMSFEPKLLLFGEANIIIILPKVFTVMYIDDIFWTKFVKIILITPKFPSHLSWKSYVVYIQIEHVKFFYWLLTQKKKDNFIIKNENRKYFLQPQRS